MSISEKEDLYFEKKKLEDDQKRAETGGFRLNLYTIEERQDILDKQEKRRR